MPYRGNLTYRLVELQLLLAERPRSQQELVQHFRVNRKTIRKDIDALSMHHPITEERAVYRSTVFWTLSSLKSCCLSQHTTLLMSDLGRRFVSMPPNQPGLIVLTLKLMQRQAECFHGVKGLEP